MKTRIYNLLVISYLLLVVTLSGCTETTYSDPFTKFDTSTFELSYSADIIPVAYNLGKDTAAFYLTKPTVFKLPANAYYRIAVDTIMGDSSTFITNNLGALKAMLRPTSAFSPYPVLYPNDVLDGTLRIDFKTLKNKKDAQRATLAYFKKGKYRVFLKLLTPNGIVYNKTSSVNFEVPSISISVATNLLALNVVNGIAVEGIFKVASDDVKRTDVNITLNSSDFEISETNTSAPGKTPVTTFVPVSSASLTYEPTIDLFTKPIFIRLKAGFTVGTIKTGTITVTHTGQNPIVVNLKGEVK